MSIKLTEAAAEEVKRAKEDDSYLRVGVKGGGSSGFEYNPNAVKSCGCGSSFSA